MLSLVMASWGGTSTTTTRMSTLYHDSSIGMTRRPRRNFTPRSYSYTNLIDESTRKKSTATSVPMSPNPISLTSLRGNLLAGCVGNHLHDLGPLALAHAAEGAEYLQGYGEHDGVALVRADVVDRVQGAEMEGAFRGDEI